MASTAVKTTDIEITDSTVHLSDTQKAYVDNGIAKGLADMKAGRSTSDLKKVKADVLKLFNERKDSYLSSL